MREIMFRAKRIDNGEWVYGYPLLDTAPCSLKAEGKCVCPHDGSNAVMYYWDDGFHEYDSEAINSETLGQYTGFTDKNCAKIFEGDIIKTKKYGKFSERAIVNDFDTFVVQYEPCMFRLVNKNRAFNLVHNKFDEFEVVGNVHDNPELIGGDTK